MPLLEASLKGALLIGILVLLRAPLRRLIGSPWLCALWLVVLVRLALPGSLPSPWSIFNWVPEKKSESATNTPVTARVTVLPVSDSAVETKGPTSSVAAATHAAELGRDWLTFAWLVGVCVSMTMLGWRIWQTARMGRFAQLADHPTLLAAFDSIPPRLRKNVGLRQSSILQVPALIGLFRPQIWMPASWLETMSEGELRHILLHELGHARRGDLWVQWLFAAAQCIHWFNPAVWLAARLAHADRELACDAWVLRRTATDEPERYGETLVKAAQLLHTRWHLAPAAVAMAMNKGSLFARVQSIGRWQPISGWRAIVGAIGVTFLLGSFATDRLNAQSRPASGLPPATSAGASPSAAPATPAEFPDRKFSLEFDRMSDFPVKVGSGQLQLPKPAIQVEVEARFIQMPEAGWQRLGLGGLAPGDPQMMQVAGTLDPKALQALFARINDVGGYDLLSAPRVTTKSGQRAVIEIIREVRYGVEFDRDEKGVDGLTPTAFETRNVGVTLEAEPTVAWDHTIDLKIVPQVVELTGFTRVRTGQPVQIAKEPGQKGFDWLNVNMPNDMVVQPMFSVRKVTTSVSLRSGHTIVVGGLKQASASEPDEVPQVLFVLITAKVINQSGGSITGPSTMGAGEIVQPRFDSNPLPFNTRRPSGGAPAEPPPIPGLEPLPTAPPPKPAPPPSAGQSSSKPGAGPSATQRVPDLPGTIPPATTPAAGAVPAKR
jgi:bla regulator protein blaR1